MPGDAATEILPGRLWWAGLEHSSFTRDASKAHRMSLSSIDAPDFLHGQYRVIHYPLKAYGSAFGPLSLAQVTRWCWELGVELEAREKVLVEHDCNIEDWANSAVFLGAFLILQKGWSTRSLAQALPREAKLCFPCSWSRPAKDQRHVLRVEDCWGGLELARHSGWVRIGSLGDADRAEEVHDASLVELAISQYYCMMAEYDASWIAPGEIMVAADPMTCVMDPNPATCPSMGLDDVCDVSTSARAQGVDDEVDGSPLPRRPSTLSEEDASELRSHWSRKLTANTDYPTATAGVDACQVAGLPYLQPLPTHQSAGSAVSLKSRRSSVNTMDSVLTVAKDYMFMSQKSTGLFHSERPAPIDFTSFCRKHDVRTVVRANSGNEDGIREIGGSYNENEFRHVTGIEQVDFFVSDASRGAEANGGLPGPEVLRRFLWRFDKKNVPGAIEGGVQLEHTAATEGVTEGGDNATGALLVHCKGGFGRSMMLALCLLISRHDLPGRALLGWARVARPGAITTTQQEKFLAQIKGRADLYRAIGLDRQPGCCSVQ